MREQKKARVFNKGVKINLFLLLLITLCVCTSVVNASIEDIGTVKQYDCITLPQTCNCTFVNITTIMFPDKTYTTINQEMTRDGTYFNFTFCNTSMIGMHIVNGVGNNDGSSSPFNYWFEVTTTGNNAPYAIPLFLGLAAFILLILAFVMKNNYIGFITGTLFIVLGLYLMIYGLSVISDFYTQSLAYISLGVGLLLLLASAYSAINDSNINLFGIGRGDDDDDF